MKINEKKYIIFFLFLLIICNITYASCIDDANQMRAQILEHGSITLNDGNKVIAFEHVEKNDPFCEATAYLVPDSDQCPMDWVEGSWANTVKCHYPVPPLFKNKKK